MLVQRDLTPTHAVRVVNYVAQTVQQTNTGDGAARFNR